MWMAQGRENDIEKSNKEEKEKDIACVDGVLLQKWSIILMEFLLSCVSIL